MMILPRYPYSAFYAIVCAAILAVTGCSPLIMPTPYHVPAVQNQGDLHVNVLTGISEFNVQAAFMPVKHMVVTTTYSTNVENHNDEGHVYRYNSFGAGYITGDERIQVAVLGHYGFGRSRDNSLGDKEKPTQYNKFTGVNYYNLAIQPYANYLISENFNLYGGVRASVIRTTSFVSNESDRLSPGKTGTLEPFLGMRFGYKALMFEMQSGIYSHKNTYDRRFISHNDALLNFHVGIGYTFGLGKKAIK